ncbi:MAG: MarR family transcriptional regulator [Mesorhizobium sp.]|nr:MAG: MarR family transcriptional regulator [Mesorhizobium sp.]
MNFKNLIKRAEDVDNALQELQDDLADALDASLDSDYQTPTGDDVPDAASAADASPPQADAAPADAADVPDGTGSADTAETTPRLTPHAQTRLAALNAFEGMFHDARDYLDEINGKLSEISTSHHLTREFLNILHTDILRANELELANAGLIAEQRALSEKLHDTAAKLRERDGACELLQQRETSLVQDRETLRATLAAVRLELAEAANASAKRDAEFGDIANRLTARTVEANRRLRESKMLREKHVTLSAELDKVLKRETQARHRLDELSTIHASEAARLAELLEIEPISVSRLVDRMEEGGWIERRSDAADRRVRMIFPTEKANAAYADVKSLAGEVYEESLSGVSPEDRRVLIRALDVIVQNLTDGEASSLEKIKSAEGAAA